MSTKKNNLTTLNEFKDKHYGPRGTAKRDALEAGYESFKNANAEVAKAPTAPELADLFGAYQGEETAEELLAAIRGSNVSSRNIEPL